MIKHIFIYWHQGWDEAPEICKICKQTWVDKNPDWEVIALDRNSIKDFLPLATIEAASRIKPIQTCTDLLRLALVAAHGGLWVDATHFCNKSLTSWLTEDLLYEGLYLTYMHRKDPVQKINFLYASGAGNIFFKGFVEHTLKKIATGDFNFTGSYKNWQHRLNRSWRRYLVKNFGTDHHKVLFARQTPRKDELIIANSLPKMQASVDDNFKAAVEVCAFFKLTWRRGKSERFQLPVEEVFDEGSKFRYLLNTRDRHNQHD